MRFPPGTLAPTLAVLVATFAAAMDITVMQTAMPTIVGELGGLALFSWSFTAYLLASTIVMLLYGNLADRYGRKPLLLLALAVFLVGSLLCGFAPTMEWLIFWRAVQGLGAGGLLTLPVTVAGDLFPLEQRARIQGIMSGIWGLAAIVGPLIGTIVVLHVSWRWVFWLNVPLALATALLLALTLREQVAPRRSPIDFAGALLLTLGLTSFLLGLVQGGERGFVSPPVPGLFGAAAVLLALFAYVERRAAEPVVPFALLRRRIVGLTSLAGLVLGAAIYGPSAYLPLWVQGVQAGTPLNAGYVSAAISVAWTAGSLAGGWVLVQLGLRASGLLGMSVVALAATLLVLVRPDSPLGLVLAACVVLGVGLGIGATAFIVAVQTAVAWDQRGAATALQQFCRAIGGTVWVSVQGAALSAVAAAELAARGVQLGGDGPTRLGELNAMLTPATRARLDVFEVGALTAALASGLHVGFALFLGLALAGVLVAALLPSARLGDAPAEAAPVTPP